MRKSDKAAALDKDLKALFGALQARALPDRVRCVIDQIYVVEPPEPVRKAS
ncbi:hypothetical protein LRS10_15560 [Phenylobacterium sp. J426]|uniref:hypothetical protein n=1 Tax=Phenylobacterium sp. J426 TaxID=2898439 RepID=UPI0021512944|nr:hypothetical protein [Phenylobacterium sp. J426]MCR5875474.1 hypothetical protein [Phenylobacterium sp. J426]